MKKYPLVFLIITGIAVCAQAFSVEVKSDLTKNEEIELSIDESVSKTETKRFELLNEKIALHIKADQLDDAVKVFQKLVEAFYKQDNWSASQIEKSGFQIACAYINSKEFDKAVKFSDDLLKFTQDNSVVFYIKHLALEGLGKTDDALKMKERAISFNAEDQEYRFEIAQFFFSQKLYTVAETEFLKLMTLTEDEKGNSEYYINARLFLGRIAYDKGEFQEATKHYEEVAKSLNQQGLLAQMPNIQREIISAYLNAARDFEIVEDFAKEFETIEAVEKLVGTGFLNVMNASAASLTRLKRYDEAIKKYETIIKLAPDIPDTLAGYGDALEKAGRKEEAEKQYEKAINLYKKNIEKANADKEELATNLNNLAWFYAIHKRDIEEGIKLSKQSLELRPDEAAYLDTLAELYFQNGQKDEARKYIKQAIDKKPHHLLYYQQQLEKFEMKSPDKEETK